MKKLLPPLIILFACTFSTGVFLLSYRHDNKYTAGGPQASHGVLMLSEQSLLRWPVVHLIDGWEIYRGQLLTPADLSERWIPPDEFVFIGQYGGFESQGAALPPHGSATYRLSITLPEGARSYTLELPEIFSAYKLYINGLPAAEMGETDPNGYRPHTGNRSVTVQAGGRIEILVAVSDFSHFYSGMVYPPAFGLQADVEGLLLTRLGIRVAACAVSACLGLLSFALWLFTKRGAKDDGRLQLYYAAVCLLFILYAGHPVIKTLWHGGMGWYVVENTAFCAMFLLVALISRRQTGLGAVWIRPFAFISVLVCLCSLTSPLWTSGGLGLMMAYSWLIEAFYWVCALFLTFCAAYGVYRGKSYGIGMVMLAGCIMFVAALVVSRLLPMHEPIRFGWFTETAGAALVLCVGLALVQDSVAQHRLSRAMESRAETVSRVLDAQRLYFQKLLEREGEVEAALHDLRHHAITMRRLQQEGDGEKLDAYLSGFAEDLPSGEPVFYCKHYLTNSLLAIYAGFAKQQTTVFNVRAELPEDISIKDADLCAILSNLLENALEAAKKIPEERRAVSVNISLAYETLGIMVQNPFDGSLQGMNGRFFSTKTAGRKGVGLASVSSICRSYGGEFSFYADEGNVFHSEVMIPVRV